MAPPTPRIIYLLGYALSAGYGLLRLLATPTMPRTSRGSRRMRRRESQEKEEEEEEGGRV